MPVSPIPFDITVLVAYLQQKQQPVLIHDLAYQVAAAYLHSQLPKRQYAPGATYQAGETIWHKGQSGPIVTAQWGANRKQGRFQMLQLRLSNGDELWLAAAIPHAPSHDQAPTPDTAINQLLDPQGLALRTAIQQTLANDGRFVHFQDEQGDTWCLQALLPSVTEAQIRQVYSWLNEAKATDSLRPQPTQTLSQRLWGQVDDSSSANLCRIFALNTALQQYAEFHFLIGGGWLLRETWEQYRNRTTLSGPRQRNIVPSPTTPDTTRPASLTIESPEAKETTPLLDIKEWEQKRRLNVGFTLTAHHLVGQWLPFNRDTQFVLPPCPMAVSFHCQWGDEMPSFTAYVDPESSRIFADPLMATIFEQGNVYPGAKLVISRRENWQDYDLRLKPLETPRLVRVRRLDLDEQGHLELYDDDQLVTYEIDENEFVAQARWEHLEALFLQAEEAGAGIFQIMFETCQRWEQERGKPLLVMETELFEAIHTGPRLTSRATIVLEMWQRDAFEQQADGRYLFRPEQGDRTRPQPTSTRRIPPLISRAVPQRRLRPSSGSPAQPVPPTPTRPRVPFHRDANVLWQAVMGDTTRQKEIETAIRAYQRDSFREKMMLLRGLAHLRIHKLLAQPRLSQLTLDDFNQHVWQIGSFKYQGQTGRIDKSDGEKLLSRLSVAEMKNSFAEGRLVFTGNQTWGSGTGIYAPQIKESSANKLERLRQTLDYLLYSPAPIVQRLEQVLNESNGFGINIVTGLLHAVFPNEFILYNQRSADMLTALGVDWPLDWRHNVPAYLTYRDFCLRLREQYNFLNLTDVDWFIYGWGQWHTGEMKLPPVPENVTLVEQTPPPPEPPVFLSGSRPQIVTHSDEGEARYRGQPLTPFWSAVQKLEGTEVYSRVSNLILHITRVRSYRVEFRRDAGLGNMINGTILRSELEPIWNELIQQGERRLDTDEVGWPGFSVLAELPGVRLNHNPPTLLYQASSDAVQSNNVHPKQLHPAKRSIA